MAADKVVAAASTAPLLLANAGLLKGRKVTCAPSVQEQVVGAGAEWSKGPVVEDGKLLTCATPESSKRLCRFVVYLLRPDFRE
jgi:protease I